MRRVQESSMTHTQTADKSTTRDAISGGSLHGGGGVGGGGGGVGGGGGGVFATACELRAEETLALAVLGISIKTQLG